MENISFDLFKQIDLRVAEIKACEDVPGADRLYKLTIDIGGERQIVAGIKAHYTKEELIGKKIAVVANLEPRTIRGLTSHGMLLAASDPEKNPWSFSSPTRGSRTVALFPNRSLKRERWGRGTWSAPAPRKTDLLLFAVIFKGKIESYSKGADLPVLDGQVHFDNLGNAQVFKRFGSDFNAILGRFFP